MWIKSIVVLHFIVLVRRMVFTTLTTYWRPYNNEELLLRTLVLTGFNYRRNVILPMSAPAIITTVAVHTASTGQGDDNLCPQGHGHLTHHSVLSLARSIINRLHSPFLTFPTIVQLVCRNMTGNSYGSKSNDTKINRSQTGYILKAEIRMEIKAQ